MVSARTMGIILAHAVPYINQNLSSVDFLNAHVQRTNGKLPFFDDETQNMQLFSRKGAMPKVRTRPSTHLKDSWRIEVSASREEGIGYVYLSNDKRTADGRWNVAELIWEGTSPYFINVPTLYSEVLVSAVPGVAQTQFPNLKQFRKYRPPTPALRGHMTGAMTFYNRYTGHWNYNRSFRRGIRNELVSSFRQFILICVENGIRTAIEMMTNEGILKSKISDVHVRIQK